MTSHVRRICIGCNRLTITGRYKIPGHTMYNAKGLCRGCYDKGRTRSQRRRQPSDWVKIDRAIHGIHIRLTSREITQAVDYLSFHGHSAREIADRLGVTPRTVHRARARVRTQLQQEKAA